MAAWAGSDASFGAVAALPARPPASCCRPLGPKTPTSGGHCISRSHLGKRLSGRAQERCAAEQACGLHHRVSTASSLRDTFSPRAGRTPRAAPYLFPKQNGTRKNLDSRTEISQTNGFKPRKTTLEALRSVGYCIVWRVATEPRVGRLQLRTSSAKSRLPSFSVAERPDSEPPWRTRRCTEAGFRG